MRNTQAGVIPAQLLEGESNAEGVSCQESYYPKFVGTLGMGGNRWR